MSRASADAIVVGAGIVGAAVAEALTADGLDVAVLDAAFPASGATGGGMGHVVVMDDSPAQLALTAWSRRLLHDLADELPAQVELDGCGTLWLAEDGAQLDAARSKQAYLSGRGLRAELLDARALADAEPALRPGLAGALLVPDDLVIYPPALCRWLLDRARDRGASIHAGAPVAAVRPGVVELAEGRMQAPVVVNAAGAAAARLTPGLDVVPRRGHLVITERAPGFCRHQLAELGYLKSAHGMSAASVAFNIQPRLTGQVLVGSSRELVGWDSRLNREILHAMLRRAAAFMPSLGALRAIRAWTAFRPATPDRLPYIGAVDDGVWAATGHEGLGITTALATGRMVADLVAGRNPAIDPAPYAPSRRVRP